MVGSRSCCDDQGVVVEGFFSIRASAAVCYGTVLLAEAGGSAFDEGDVVAGVLLQTRADVEEDLL